ncbi:MAG: methyltransferase domain-containing protein [Pseudobdellovibrio sp.]
MKTTLHYHLVNSLSQALTEVFENGKYADRVIDKYLRTNRKWGARDRKLFAESTYEIVRHKRRLEYIAESENVWELIGAYYLLRDIQLPDWEEFDNLKSSVVHERSRAKKPLAVEYSFPDWLMEIGEKEFKTEWPELIKHLNEPAEVFLRANLLKGTPESIAKDLAAEDIHLEPLKVKKFDLSSCLKLKQRQNVFITKTFKDGKFEMQDAASQLVAPLLDVQPGLRVVDACAGAGGKSLHIAAMMKNKGKIIAMDIHEWKLKELRDRCSRAGVDILETKLIDSSKTVKRLENSFDRVLLDVPCSGLGVIRRNPDTKWKLTPEEIERLIKLQREIISQYSVMCKAGGKMVYATCSILHSENEEQVKWFLTTEAGKGWSLVKEMRVWPHIDKFDGFYAAVLEKK